MATWLVHLRVADVLLGGMNLPRRDFLAGNIAPDCGLPTSDGGFDPPKQTTHWTTQSKGRCNYSAFAEHMFPLANNDNEWAFLLGYYAHLMTDCLWVKLINDPCKIANRELYSSDRSEYYRRVKADWYDNDAAYLTLHPNLSVLTEFSSIECYDSSIIPYYGADNVQRQIVHIAEFYRKRIYDGREFVYLTPEQVNIFVPTAAELISRQLMEYV